MTGKEHIPADHKFDSSKFIKLGWGSKLMNTDEMHASCEGGMKNMQEPTIERLQLDIGMLKKQVAESNAIIRKQGQDIERLEWLLHDASVLLDFAKANDFVWPDKQWADGVIKEADEEIKRVFSFSGESLENKEV